MRIHILSALLGVTTTLLAVALFWPGAAPTTHAQTDGVLQLDPEWNNVAYGGDPLPIEQALNDALGITDTVWLWRSLAKSWDSWTQGALDLLNSLGGLDHGDVVSLRTHLAGVWTQLGTAQELAPGPAGLSCWDLNGDGVFDPEEDMDGDGVATALDCRGSAGEPGPEGPTGPEGAVGLQGPVGPQGADGADELQNYEVVQSSRTIGPGSFGGPQNSDRLPSSPAKRADTQAE